MKCRNCKDAALPDRKYCQKHLDYINQKARERVGKCKQCSEPAANGKSRCLKHQEEIKIKSAERKARLKANRLCKDCGEKALDGLVLCEECNNKAKTRNKFVLQQRQLENKCTFCGGDKENLEKAYCDQCSKKDNERLRERTSNAKENQICTRCRKNNSVDDGSFCEDCYVSARDYFKKYKKDKVSNGICYRCKNPRIASKLYCHSCAIEHAVRRSIINALRKKQIPKSAKTEEIIGCTIVFFREHIRNLMEPWMNENNYGVHIPGEQRWQLGHIVPRSSFDLTDPDQLKKCWHYTNIYPQEAKENIELQDWMFHRDQLVRGRYLRESQ